MTHNLKPDAQAIKAHLDFLFSGYNELADGMIEIAYTPSNTGAVSKAELFYCHDIEKASQRAFELNSQEGVNVYVGAALRVPDAPENSRSNSTHFYASNVLWLDLDDAGQTKEAIEKYKDLPPSRVIITGLTPHERAQMWWKLDEPEYDFDDLKNHLSSLCQFFNGDEKVADPARVMRLGGTIAWAKKEGRVNEATKYVKPREHTEDINIHRITDIYNISSNNLIGNKLQGNNILDDSCQLTDDKNNISSVHSEGVRNLPVSTPSTQSIVSGLDTRLNDGRESYMNSMVFSAIINLTAENGCLPALDEVFKDVWPVYSSKVTPRGGKTLNQEGRGDVALRSKIRSKLRAFEQGHIRGMETVEKIVAQGGKPKVEKTPEIARVAEYEPKRGDMQLIMADDIKVSLESADFVEDLLEDGKFSVVYGESNCGKSFFMTDLAFHVAQGKMWRGKGVDQGGVIYAALEGASGLGKRVLAYKTENKDAIGMPFAMIKSQLNFCADDGGIDELITLINESQDKLPNVRLIIIDTLARALAGADENSGQDMGMLVAHADKIREHTGAHICFVHHSGKDKARGARGHSSLRAAVDTEIEVSREEGEDHGRIKVVKQRDMEIIDEMGFTLKTVSIGVDTRRNKEITSCVVQEFDLSSVTSIKKDKPLTDNQAFILNNIREAIGEYGAMRSPYKGMDKRVTITFEDLRNTLELNNYKDLYHPESTSSKVRSATQSARNSLERRGYIGSKNGYIWLNDADNDGSEF